jgi:hypothetical protein
MQEEPFFNPTFISEHHIREISGQVSVKLSGHPVAVTNEITVYRFDQRGNLTAHLEVNRLMRDTVRVQYIYNKANELVMKKVHDRGKVQHYHYAYNDHGDMIWMKMNQPGSMFEGNDEVKFNYTYFDSQHAKIEVINSENRLSRTETRNYNASGQPVELSSKQAIGSARTHQGFVYTTSGQLEKMIHKISTASGTRTYTYHYEWEENGAPSKEQIFFGAEAMVRKEFIYQNGLLNALLIKDEHTERIRIIEYSYTMFDQSSGSATATF